MTLKEKALITGYDGFTGKYCSALLRSRGFDVAGLVHHGGNDQDVFACDLNDKARLAHCIQQTKPDYVLHLAGQAFVAQSNEKSFYEVNLFGTLNLLEALASQAIRPKKIILVSSANIYGAPDQITLLDENVCPAPVNHYATSKMAMEFMARTWFDRFPIVIVRPFNYTGPGQDENFLVPKIVSHFRRRTQTIELGNLNIFRDFSDVRDVARAYADLMVSNATSEVFNVCSGNTYSLQQIIDCAAEITGHTIAVRVNPAFVRKNEIARLQGDNSKLVNKIGYRIQHNLSDTLEAMLAQ